MAKLKLKPDASFKHTVIIPVAGSAEGAEVEFEYRHRGAEQMVEFLKEMENREPIDVVMDAVQDWDLEEPFCRENVAVLIDNYALSAGVIIREYEREIFKARAGN